MSVKSGAPCGGGAKFAAKFSEYLKAMGHVVEYSFDSSSPPDCLFFFDHKLYRDNVINKWIGLEQAREIRAKFPDLPIITRINDIGAPKNRPPDFVNRFCELANLSNHVIYVSKWLKDDYYFGKIISPSSVIHNPVDENIFTIKNYSFDKPRLFTHHWSSCRMKGWDIYEQIDDWILGKNIEFTFVGNLPNNVVLKNSKVLPPITDSELANEIRAHNIYITASKYEPCGNHYIEGIACGLPYLYTTEGGGIKEAGEFGLEFESFDGFKTKFKKIIKEHRSLYDEIRNSFKYYNKDAFPEYHKIIKKTHETFSSLSHRRSDV